MAPPVVLDSNGKDFDWRLLADNTATAEVLLDSCEVLPLPLSGGTGCGRVPLKAASCPVHCMDGKGKEIIWIGCKEENSCRRLEKRMR